MNSGSPACWLYPVAGPRSLGCSAFSRGKYVSFPFSEISSHTGNTLAAGEMIKGRKPRSQGGGQKAQPFPRRWYPLPMTSENALGLLNNDLVILLTLINSAWCADRSGPGGNLFGLRQARDSPRQLVD